jgi:dUTPase
MGEAMLMYHLASPWKAGEPTDPYIHARFTRSRFINADYRGEIKVLLVNLGPQRLVVTRGMRIAQLVVAPVWRARFIETEHLELTRRNTGAFGSTSAT